MKRLAGAALALVFVIALAFAATPVLLSADRLESAVVAALEDMTGRDVTITGETTIFPNLRLTVEGIRIAGDAPGDPPLLTAESLSAVFGIMPVVLGRFELSEVHFRKPRLRLSRDRDGGENWRGRGLLETILARPGAAAVRSPLGRVTVEAGTVTFSESGIERLRLRDVVGLIDWPNLGRSVHLAGSLRWRREVIDLDLRIEEPLDLIDGGASDLSFEIVSAPLRAEFSGTGAIHATLQLDGEARATAPSLANVAVAVGLPAGPEIGAVSVEGTLTWDNDQFSLADASVEIDGDGGQGGLYVALAPTPLLRGTLAFNTLDLAPSSVDTASLDANAVEDGIAGLAPLLGGALRTDLRLSATHLRYGPLQAGPAAATLVSGEDGVILSIGEIGFADGMLQGEVRATPGAEGGVAIATELAATGIDLAKAMNRLALPAPFTGTLTGRFEGDALASRLADLPTAISGHLVARLADGSVAMNRLWDADPQSGALPPGTATPFDTLAVTGELAPTTIRLDPVAGASGETSLSATLDIERGNGTIRGDLNLERDDSTSAFLVSGTLAAPVLAPLSAER